MRRVRRPEVVEPGIEHVLAVQLQLLEDQLGPQEGAGRARGDDVSVRGGGRVLGRLIAPVRGDRSEESRRIARVPAVVEQAPAGEAEGGAAWCRDDSSPGQLRSRVVSVVVLAQGRCGSPLVDGAVPLRTRQGAMRLGGSDRTRKMSVASASMTCMKETYPRAVSVDSTVRHSAYGRRFSTGRPWGVRLGSEGAWPVGEGRS